MGKVVPSARLPAASRYPARIRRTVAGRTFEQSAHGVAMRLGDQVGQFAADNLFRAVAEQGFGRRVEELDDAGAARRHHSGHGIVDDGLGIGLFDLDGRGCGKTSSARAISAISSSPSIGTLVVRSPPAIAPHAAAERGDPPDDVAADIDPASQHGDQQAGRRDGRQEHLAPGDGSDRGRSRFLRRHLERRDTLADDPLQSGDQFLIVGKQPTASRRRCPTRPNGCAPRPWSLPA